MTIRSPGVHGLVPLPVKRRNGHTLPSAPPPGLLLGPGRLRRAHILALFGYSDSTLLRRIRSGAFPPCDGRDGSIPYWTTDTVRGLLSCDTSARAGAVLESRFEEGRS
jgi:hypothetical protein